MVNYNKGRIPHNKIDPTKQHNLSKGKKRKCVECNYLYCCCRYCGLCKYCHYKKFTVPFEEAMIYHIRENDKLRARDAIINPGKEKSYNDYNPRDDDY